MSKFTRKWKSIAAFFRFEYLPGTIIPPFFGAVMAAVPLTKGIVAGLFGISATFHLFVGLGNDIVDLPMDRKNPARAYSPLVRGIISRRTAFIVALLQIPIAGLIIHFQLGKPIGYVVIGTSFVCACIYNLWNKVTRFPILMDLIQGIGACAPIIYGALLSGHVSIMVWISALSGMVWMVLLNLLGGMRDLHTDAPFDVNTTPISMGVKPLDNGRLLIPAMVRNYGYILQFLTIAGGITVFLLDSGNYSSGLKIIMLSLCIVYGIISMISLTIYFKASSENEAAMMSAGFFYLGITALILLVIIIPLLPWWANVLTFIFFIIAHRNYRIHPMVQYINAHK
jgi:4-hydroxybenzoate polyprenyltransferase